MSGGNTDNRNDLATSCHTQLPLLALVGATPTGAEVVVVVGEIVRARPIWSNKTMLSAHQLMTPLSPPRSATAGTPSSPARTGGGGAAA
ncbi:hypothetical protein MPDQ_007830 [Monascus purpureus]|uniref:Uncharacterized protein n=1 Tax=Monascus purpureus TaxID=5098 RepID=A0A507QVJ6_MONPU|nr:hypothetical protein MPDQ_007830 [Monascus purpureus]